MRVVIADDEPIARSILREELESFRGYEVVAEAENGQEALSQVEKHRPDLLLLDLDMPILGGFGVIAKLEAEDAPAVILVTAYNEHAIRAFEAGAVDYLVKPVSRERLAKSLDRLRTRTQLPDDVAPPNKIVGKLGEEYILLDPKEVLAFLAEGDEVWVMTMKNRYTATHSLRALEHRVRRLPFERVHRSALVNVNHVRKMSALSSQRWLLTLTNGMELTVSKRQAQSVRRILKW